MTFNFGKHRGKTLETVLLKHADYVYWMLTVSEPNDYVIEAGDRARKLIDLFDDKPILLPCSGRDCPNPATRFSAYKSTTDLMPWCSSCPPTSMGADPGKLTIVTTYWEALGYANWYCSGRDAKARVIRSMAEGKGLPMKPRIQDILDFFYRRYPDQSRRRASTIHPNQDPPAKRDYE